MKVQPNLGYSYYSQQRQNSKITTNTQNQNRSDFVGNLNRAKYPISFGGLFLEKPTDTRDMKKPIEMKPLKRYIVSDNARFKLGSKCIVDLEDSIIKEKLENLGVGKKIIIGREGIKTKEMDACVSRKHLELSKNIRGEIIAKDLCSLNGTTILDKAEKEKPKKEYPKLAPYKRTTIPNNCQLILGTDLVFDMRNGNLLEMLDKKGTITIGRSQQCDIIVDDFHNHTSRKHLQLEKIGDKIIATDLNSTNGTYVVPNKRIKPFYNGTQNIELSQSNIGDCYLLSTLYALSRTDVGAKMLEKMVSVDRFGNYIVKFHNSEPIVIRPDELDGQKSNCGEATKRSVRGELGVKALERAYGRDVKLEDDLRTLYADIDDGGYTYKTLYKIAGIGTKFHYTSSIGLERTLRKIKKDGLEKHVLTCTTSGPGNNDGFIDEERRFIEQHAYAIDDIDTQEENITIVNPHNTKKKFVISWDEFSRIFYAIYDAKIS